MVPGCGGCVVLHQIVQLFFRDSCTTSSVDLRVPFLRWANAYVTEEQEVTATTIVLNVLLFERGFDRTEADEAPGERARAQTSRGVPDAAARSELERDQ